MALAKIFVLASLCFVYANADFSHVASIVAEAIEHGSVKSAAAAIRDHTNRFKREIVNKTVEDPQDCVRKCTDEKEIGIIAASTGTALEIAANAIADALQANDSNPSDNDQSQANIQEQAVNITGALFDELCNITSTAATCLQACPQGLLRDVSVLDNDAPKVLFCEPGSWPSSKEFDAANTCINNTEHDHESECKSKCGEVLTLFNVSHIRIKEKRRAFHLKYENDSKKNAAAAAETCKSISCNLDCYKPFVAQKCGDKAADYYVHTAKAPVHSIIGILKALNAIEDVSECKSLV